MGFNLSTRSLNRLQGVNTSLQSVVRRAIQLTKIDFGVIEGVRTVERQQQLFDSKASQTMKVPILDVSLFHHVKVSIYQF